ncbi:MAG TPA: glycosyltransferase [Thermoanaerobaculia bacterium]|nr:glycosyltransferase [Thermoanaerobaculia bacterium]
MTRDAIQSLWIGGELSPMERLAIASFLQHGHRFELYVYDEVRNVPAGTTLRDAGEILPRERVFRYREHDTVSGFSNFFRYRLLLERGGWWVDTDVVCLRPFDFAGEHVFASEPARDGSTPASCVIRAPRGSAAMQLAWERCDARDASSLRWGETGPRLVKEVVAECGLEEYVQPSAVFCPLPFHAWRSIIEGPPPRFGEPTRAVHLWNDMWRRAGARKDDVPAGTLYAELIARALGDRETCSAPRPARASAGPR